MHRRLFAVPALLVPFAFLLGATEPAPPPSAPRVEALASSDAGAVTAQSGDSGVSLESSAASAVMTADAGLPVGGTLVAGGAGLDGGTLAMVGLVPPSPVPSREKAPPLLKVQGLPHAVDLLARAKLEGEQLVVKDGKGAKARALTIDPVLQASLTQILRTYEVPFGAAVVLEPATGRVLAMAEHSQARPDLRGLAVRAAFPAASIFKIVTGSALLEAGVTPETEECFHGGKRRLSEKHLEDSDRDGACLSLALAMGKSANVIFAKMTHKHLSVETLRRMAARFHFNREIPFAVPTDVSLAAIPEDEFGLANTGAGFGDVFLSPLHGALLAAVAANGGRWVDPVLFEPDLTAPPPEGEAVLTPTTARALTAMLEETVTHGTARHIFRERGFRVDGAVGKTGTLADREPFHDYSWFVGFAPKEHPRVAVAALVVNDPKWRIRGSYLGREALRLGLERVPAPMELTAPASAAGKH
ncbi:penicillin-binding protein [Corallococcus sp. M34]|nr:penicillin-binding transpeptidase domain-containing protein [Citreicoccus inhibens]MBU8900617.1 penicillin-binding protein [Citreicoccus inhibens]